MFKQLLSGYYSVSQGISTAASVGYSVYHKSKSAAFSGIAASGAFIADTIASYWFQGASIRRADIDDSERKRLYVPINDQEQPKVTNEDELHDLPTIKTACVSTSSIITQLFYAGLDVGKNFANRYFLFLVILKLFQTELSLPSFWGILIADLMLKELFNLSNETYEVEETIAQQIEGEEAKPFYKSMFAPFKNQKALKFFKFAGSLEHTVVDDLAPFLALLPTEAMDYLMEHSNIKLIVIVLSTLVGVPLALLVFLQTYLFEGEHTEQHLKEIYGELVETETTQIPHKLAAILKKTINIMGPIHGIASAASVHISLRDLIADPYIKWPVSIIAGIFTFLGTAVGVHLSEVRESKEQLEQIAAPSQLYNV